MIKLTCGKGYPYFEAIVLDEHNFHAENGIFSHTGESILSKGENVVIYKQPHKANFFYHFANNMYRVRTFPKNLVLSLIFPQIEFLDKNLNILQLLRTIHVHGAFTTVKNEESINNVLYVVIREYHADKTTEIMLNHIRDSKIYLGEFEHGIWHRVLVLDLSTIDYLVDKFYKGQYSLFPDSAKKQALNFMGTFDHNYWSSVFYKKVEFRKNLESVLGVKLDRNAEFHQKPTEIDFEFDKEQYIVDIAKDDLRFRS